jgi:hypothetical protein
LGVVVNSKGLLPEICWITDDAAQGEKYSTPASKRVNDGKDVVAADQLVHGTHRQLRLAAVVFHHHAQLAAVDAAGLIDLIKPHLHAVAQVRHTRSHRARQVHVGAKDNFFVRDPARVCGGPQHGRQQGSWQIFEITLHNGLLL